MHVFKYSKRKGTRAAVTWKIGSMIRKKPGEAAFVAMNDETHSRLLSLGTNRDEGKCALIEEK